MIAVSVSLHSAKTGKMTKMAQMLIANDGTSNGKLRNYNVFVANKRQIDDARSIIDNPQKQGRVEQFPSDRLHIFNLVEEALENLEYGRKKKQKPLPLFESNPTDAKKLLTMLQKTRNDITMFSDARTAMRLRTAVGRIDRMIGMLEDGKDGKQDNTA